MEKTQIKPKKDKKKNTETGLLMGQNINVFSQLSANYLTNKSNVTQQQENFVKQTQIIEYHDQNINRLISLLRKKAEVTKVKAVLQLKEAIGAMNENDIEQFIPTFANLYQQIVINEQSKQVFEEFIEIAVGIFEKFKKIALKQIATLYPAMLLSMKVSKINKLLFNGSEQQMSQKAYLLLVKKDIRKKFILLSKLLLQAQQIHLITQSNYQRNIYQYVKMIKDVLNIYLVHSKRNQLTQETQNLVRDICELLYGKTIDEYFKSGGKGKASLIELFSYMVRFASQQKCDIPWKKFAKTVCQHFLDKDPVVQSTLWKYCNKDIIISLRQLSKQEEKEDQYALFNENLPKSEQKLLQVLGLGGLSMYKALPSYVKEHPSFVFKQQSDSHKSIVQKVTFMRKLLQQIMAQQDQNEARIECYYSVSEYLIESTQQLEKNLLQTIITEKQGQPVNDSKKGKEIKTLIEKLKVEIVSHLQKRFYSDPPVSKNYFTFYVPQYFCRILNKFEIPNFSPTFNDKFIFQLFKDIKTDSPLLQVIYSKCEANLSLLLSFYETFSDSDKQVNLDMTENNEEYEKTARIFLLSNRKRASNKNIWFKNDWDLRKSAIIYDPRLTAQDLENEAAEQSHHDLNINFTPINKNLSEIYQFPELDQNRFQFFINLLEDNDIQAQNLKFFLPYLFAHLVTEENTNALLQKYLQRVNLLRQGKWTVGQKEIAFLRIVVKVFNIYLLKHERKIDQHLLIKFKPYFTSIGNFLKTLNTYKMDKDVLQILKELNQLLRIQQCEDQLLQCVQNILKDVFSLLNRSSISSGNQKQEKLRKNRLKRINEFVQESVWYLLRKNSDKYADIVLELFRQQHLWAQAQTKVQPWAIGYTIMSKSGSDVTIQKIAKHIIFNFDEHFKIVSLLFSCQLMLPLQIYPEFKKVYMSLQHALSKEFSQLSAESQLFNIQRLIIYQYEQGLLTQSLGLKSLLRTTLKFYQTFSNNDISILSKQIVQLMFDKILCEPQTSHNLDVKSVIIFNLLNEIPLQDLIVSLENVYQKVVQILEKQVKNLESHFHKFLSICLLANCLWRTSVGQEALLKWQQSKLIQNLLNRLVPQLKDIEPPTIYHSYVIFSTINSLYPTFGYQLVQPNLQSIMRIFWDKKENQRQSEMYIFKQQQRIRFVNRVFLDMKKESAYEIIQKLPKQALQEYGHYQKFLLQLEQQQDDEQQNSVQQKSIHGLFIEYSELLMKITTFLNLGQNKIIPDETVLIQLLQCPFAGVKKTSFILLKQLYDFKLVKPAIPQVFKEVLVFKLKSEHEIEDLNSANQVYNFLYSWLTLITRRKAIEVVSINEEEEQLSLQDYIQSSGLSELFLNNVFSLIADKIDYLKNESEFPLSSEELLFDDFTLNIDQESNISQKLFTLACKVLFAYSINFPLFLRTFMDKSKKYRSVCQKLLRNYISDAIFSKQVAMIEIKQPEWKANGNLQIYVIKKNKEIYAEYQHDVIRIGLRLVMRPNYPLTPIHIQFGQGLKMQDGSKWALMLQSQLHNKNNSIINGILLWKENIDKKLSGIEECAICYDIVDPKGHLPKKACKTCKKKFHSNCIMKWFSKSNKSECPLCKSQFL